MSAVGGTQAGRQPVGRAVVVMAAFAVGLVVLSGCQALAAGGTGGNAGGRGGAGHCAELG